ncbi:MAG: hypothetical protein JXQ91_15125 [Vannielia sp.]|uniref:hypothetical protein n=1 Tax=Rhodobacterales TaxID=204455 RepID=UPI0020940B6F|nr:hypothetical protein [Oceanicola sp. 502str15]MCO6383222.1 hypothetical protein [Oceanicola sp. 502str15]
MKHDWVIDVLADLRAYAERNGLSMLEGKLLETIDIASRETGCGPASFRGDASAEGDGGSNGNFHRGLAAGEHA